MKSVARLRTRSSSYLVDGHIAGPWCGQIIMGVELVAKSFDFDVEFEAFQNGGMVFRRDS